MNVLYKNGNLDINYILENYIAFDLPVPYKNFIIYPVKVKDFNKFIYSYDILDIKKNDLGDINIIQMSYLDFLINFIFEEIRTNKESTISIKLSNILQLCLKINSEDIKIYRSEKNNKWHLKILDTDINSKEFDEIKNIILYQNLVGYDEKDKYVDPSLRKAYEEYMRIQQNGKKEPSLDKQIASVQAHTGMSKNDLMDMTARSFKLLLNSCIKEVDYIILKTAESGGMVKFSKPIEHWVYENNNIDKYAQAFVSLDSYENKMRSVT